MGAGKSGCWGGGERDGESAGWTKRERGCRGETAWRLCDSVSFRTPHVRDTHASFHLSSPLYLSLTLSFFFLPLPLFLSLPLPPCQDLSVPLSFAISFPLTLPGVLHPGRASGRPLLRLPRSVLPRAVSLRSPPGRRRGTSSVPCPPLPGHERDQ